MLVGARDFDRAEDRNFVGSSVTRLAADAVRRGLDEELSSLRERVTNLYLHVDLDVLDPSEGNANSYAKANGLSLADLDSAIRSIIRTFHVRAMAVTAYDPAADTDGRICEAALSLISSAVDALH
jgi:arginase